MLFSLLYNWCTPVDQAERDLAQLIQRIGKEALLRAEEVLQFLG